MTTRQSIRTASSTRVNRFFAAIGHAHAGIPFQTRQLDMPDGRERKVGDPARIPEALTIYSGVRWAGTIRPA